MVRKSSTSAKTAKPAAALPAGYTHVAVGGFNPFHEFKRDKVCQGVVMGIRDVTVGKGKAKKQTRYMDILTVQGPRTISERTQLKGLFDTVGAGEEVYIRLDGTKKIPGQSQPMMLFTVALKGGTTKGSKRKG